MSVHFTHNCLFFCVSTLEIYVYMTKSTDVANYLTGYLIAVTCKKSTLPKLIRECVTASNDTLFFLIVEFQFVYSLSLGILSIFHLHCHHVRHDLLSVHPGPLAVLCCQHIRLGPICMAHRYVNNSKSYFVT